MLAASDITYNTWSLAFGTRKMILLLTIPLLGKFHFLWPAIIVTFSAAGVIMLSNFAWLLSVTGHHSVLTKCLILYILLLF